MKKITLSAFALLFTIVCNSQELPKIIPPSPEASAFHVYGNTTVNNYTGSTNVSIPIFTIKEGDLTLPIYLKYTGSNGIKVEEIASKVGLGWTLNAGGAISRVIRGVPDDDSSYGFFKLNNLPAFTQENYSFYKDMGINKEDGQPDKFLYNYPGGSGSFFFDFNENPHLKERENIIINHTKGIENESISPQNISTNNSVIKNLTISDEYGNSYFFSDKERSNTRPLNGSYTDDRSFPSSWYLNKIENRNKTREINLSYDTYTYVLQRRSANISIIPTSNNSETDIYNETTYLAKRLKSISFNEGVVEFVYSSQTRKDFNNNKFLEKILIKDVHNKLIKQFIFSYKYMTPNNLVDVNNTLTGEPEDYRLILSSLKECDSLNNCKPETKFTYETSNFLPSRNSKAQDHWGFYNGKVLNQKLEPKQYITFFDFQNYSKTVESGSSDRNPNFSFAKSGVLKSIEYPTGGKTNFQYESHSAKTNKVSGVISSKQTTMTWNGQGNKVYFSINVHSEPYLFSKVRIGGLMVNPVDCNVRVHIRKANTNDTPKQFLVSFNNGSMSINNYSVFPNHFFLESGNYECWFTYESGTQNCFQNEGALITILSDEEASDENKIIGGLRIKSIKNYNGSILSNQQNFEYIDDAGFSSGRIENGPKYYGLTLDKFSGSENYYTEYVRYVNSVNPLITSKGSEVSYSKVIVSEINKENGKTEYYYSTSENFPDGYNGVFISTGHGNEEPSYTLFKGIKIYAFPYVELSSNDYLRGSLLKEITYKKTSIGFTKVFEKDYKYTYMSYLPDVIQTPVSPGNIINSGYSKMFRAVKAFNAHPPQTDPNASPDNYPPAVYLSFYDVYNGYNLLKETKETHYNTSGQYTKTIIKTYNENTNDIIDYHVPITTEITDSRGNTNKTETTYVFNKTNKTPAETALETVNAIHLPLETKSFNGVSLLGHQYTYYNNNNTNWPGLNLPQKIQTSKGTQSLEDRVIYHNYDNKGNPTEVSKKDGTKIYYIWGYQKTQPIAKLEGYTDAELNNIQSLINTAITASDNDNSRCLNSINCTETTLRNALNTIRTNINMVNTQVTTFTYDPLIGITSITDPRGRITYYEYDSFNRLEYVKDHEGNIINNTQYNYKN